MKTVKLPGNSTSIGVRLTKTIEQSAAALPSTPQFDTKAQFVLNGVRPTDQIDTTLTPYEDGLNADLIIDVPANLEQPVTMTVSAILNNIYYNVNITINLQGEIPQ